MILKALAEALAGGEKITFTMSRGATDGEHQCVVVSTLAEEPEKLSEAGKQLRLQLARPVVVTGPMETMDADLAEFLTGLGAVRRPVANAYASVLEQLDKAATATTAKPATPAKAEAKPAAPKPADKSSKKKPPVQAAPTPAVEPPALVTPPPPAEEVESTPTAAGAEQAAGAEVAAPAPAEAPATGIFDDLE